MTDEFAVAAIIDRMIADSDLRMPPDLYERYTIYLRERFPWAGQGPAPAANWPEGQGADGGDQRLDGSHRRPTPNPRPGRHGE
jgi:hypothetical protein